MKPSGFFFRVGGTAWLLLIGGAVLILILGWLGAVDWRDFGWRAYAIWFGAGGLGAMIAGGVCAIWEAED